MGGWERRLLVSKIFEACDTEFRGFSEGDDPFNPHHTLPISGFNGEFRIYSESDENSFHALTEMKEDGKILSYNGI